VDVAVTDPTQDVVASGYDAVYEAMPRSKTLLRIWREHALGRGYPAAFEHISFLTFAEMRRMAEALRLAPGAHLVDLACGAGGPGLWIAREARARLTGIDLSSVGVAQATERAATLELSTAARFATGSFSDTALADAWADAAMSVDALQYAPDKSAAFREAARFIRPGGRLAFTAFELDPESAAALPVLGVDPVYDFGPALSSAGFDVDVYEETVGWRERLAGAYGAINAARETLIEEMGERAANSLLFETTLTLERHPYRRRVFVEAARA
jgi:SAM-dependent methyltransferase